MAEDKNLGDVKPDEKLDVTGETCPIPETMAHKRLKKMSVGQVLEVYTDHAAAVENSFPSMLNKLNYPYCVTKIAPGEFIIKIKKTS